MPKNVAEMLIASHLVEGMPTPGESIGLRIDQTLAQDATGTMVLLELEALGLDRVRTEVSAQYVDHNLIQEDHRNADDHLFLHSACRRFGCGTAGQAMVSATRYTCLGSASRAKHYWAPTVTPARREPSACSASAQGAGGLEPIAYDRLLVACGSKARPGPWPNSDLRGIGHFVTMQDLEWLEEEVHGGPAVDRAPRAEAHLMASRRDSPYQRREVAARVRGSAARHPP